MSSQNLAEVEVIYLRYSDKRYHQKPRVRKLDSFIADYTDLTERLPTPVFEENSYGRFCYRQYLWYFESLVGHFSSSPTPQLKITRWEVRSGERKAFMNNGNFYREHAYMLGPKDENYFYANPRSPHAFFGTLPNKLKMYTLDIVEGFHYGQKALNRPTNSSELLRDVKENLNRCECSKAFAMVAVAAFRIDDQSEYLDF